MTCLYTEKIEEVVVNSVTQFLDVVKKLLLEEVLYQHLGHCSVFT